MKHLLAASVALGLLGTAPASASELGLVDRATAALQHSWVYVEPAARSMLSVADARKLNARARARGGAPLRIIVASAPERGNTDDEAEGLLNALRAAMGRRGTYVVVVGDRLAAYSDAFPRSYAAAIAGQAERVQGSNGVAAMLSDFIDRLGADVLPAPDAPYIEESDESQEERVLLILLGVGAIAFLISLWVERDDRRRRMRAAR
jgi:hypothetical protein